MVPRGAQEPGLLQLHQAAHLLHHCLCTSCLVNFSLPLLSLSFFHVYGIPIYNSISFVRALLLYSGTLGVNLLLPQPPGTRKPISWSWIVSWTQLSTWMPSRASPKHHSTQNPRCLLSKVPSFHLCPCLQLQI